MNGNVKCGKRRVTLPNKTLIEEQRRHASVAELRRRELLWLAFMAWEVIGTFVEGRELPVALK